MIRPVLHLLAASLLLSACGAPMPSGKGIVGGAKAGQQPVTVAGQDFVAEVRPGAAGVMLTGAGAERVTGMTVRVSRQGTPLGLADGVPAKAAAALACGQAGGAFNNRALGRVAALGVWAFDGGCA
jgi:hypothetical protein